MTNTAQLTELNKAVIAQMGYDYDTATEDKIKRGNIMKKGQLKEKLQSIIMELESNGAVSFGGRFDDRYLIQDRQTYLREPNSRESDITPSVNYIFHDNEAHEAINFRSLNSLKKFVKDILK